jgi:Uma2 family endonuclease
MGALKLQTYTYDDYKNWEGDWELIYGYPVPLSGEKNMSPSPLIDHQRVEGNLSFEFTKNIDKCQQCEVFFELDWIVDNDTTVRPDISVVCDEVDDYIVKPPQIIVEVISKSTKQKDEETKKELYEYEKVPYYLIAYPKEKKVSIFEYSKEVNSYKALGNFRDGSFTFKNLKCKDITIDIKKIFKNIKGR